MFPYPSGELHMGHVRVYTMSDVLGRYHKACSSPVLHPMGWDAFGLPAENAAHARDVSPADWTESNIAGMRSQLDALNLDFDWEAEVSTASPEYFSHTQRLFLALHGAGMAYRANAPVNWDPVDKTVLANEQVDAEGRSWRSGALVEKRQLNQWFVAITRYADRLLDGLPTLDWPHTVKAMQENWIGRSTGYTIPFAPASSTTTQPPGEPIQVYTTRPDTLPAVEFIAVPPDSHATNPSLPTAVVHPLTGKELPVLEAEYVLEGYGTGAVMGVPLADERDAAFASTLDDHVVINYAAQGLEIEDLALDGESVHDVVTGPGVEGTATTQYRLRDWLISRQRRWGTPIPMVYCSECPDPVPVPDADLPVVFPPGISYGVGAEADPVLTEWAHDVSCPSCGSHSAVRETDTMDTFVDSSWYFLRFPDAQGSTFPASPESLAKWLPVDTYIGGIEHAILHLLYARFITMFLYDQNLVPVQEPFSSLLAQGMVHGETFQKTETGQYLTPEAARAESGPITTTFEKMSKSKYNGVDPVPLIREHGADVVRLFTLFKAPPDKVLDWEDAGIQGQARWIRRLEALSSALAGADARGGEGHDESASLRVARDTDEAIATVTRAFDQTHAFNTAVAALMKLSTSLTKGLESGAHPDVVRAAFSSLLVMLAPMAPETADTLYTTHNEGVRSVRDAGWPKDTLAETVPQVQEYLATCGEGSGSGGESSVSVIVQINGKRKAQFDSETDLGSASPESVVDFLVASGHVPQVTSSEEVKRVIQVPRKDGTLLLNVVL